MNNNIRILEMIYKSYKKNKINLIKVVFQINKKIKCNNYQRYRIKFMNIMIN
jgi:hypothetical protein